MEAAGEGLLLPMTRARPGFVRRRDLGEEVTGSCAKELNGRSRFERQFENASTHMFHGRPVYAPCFFLRSPE